MYFHVFLMNELSQLDSKYYKYIAKHSKNKINKRNKTVFNWKNDSKHLEYIPISLSLPFNQI